MRKAASGIWRRAKPIAYHNGMTLIRDVAETDLEAVLALNEECVPHVNSIPLDEMRRFAREAAYFRVVLTDDRLAAFLVGMTQDMAYGSLNFRWFCARYPSFAYVDRIAVARDARRLGLASALYDDFERHSASLPLLTCEVNLRPANEPSMRFHLARGFRQVGSLAHEGGKKVAMLVKELA